jgi:endonuclease/exonuclease/phosphatase family metal-dependent hydrolase
MLTKYSIALFFIYLTIHPVSAQETRIMTYNIKYDNANDTINNWNDRRGAVVDLIKHYQPDFLGTQEVLHNQLLYLDNSLGSHSYIGVGREDGKQKGEYSPVFYNTSKFELLKNRTFWLSEIADEVSVGWDAALERICTYGLFKNRNTGLKLYVFNSHFDHMGKVARKESAMLILQKIQEINSENLPVILMGDLNLTPDTAPIKLIKAKMEDGLEISKEPFYGPSGTFSGFDYKMILNKRIDYIFTKNVKVKSYIHIDDRMENNKYISDHLPVLLTLDTKD